MINLALAILLALAAPSPQRKPLPCELPKADPPTLLTGMRDYRYCEILLLHDVGQRATACVYNTTTVNHCPPRQWEAIDPKNFIREYQLDEVIMNGPRAWVMDEVTIATKGAALSIDGLQMKPIATAALPPGAWFASHAQRPYVETAITRDTVYTYVANKPVYKFDRVARAHRPHHAGLAAEHVSADGLRRLLVAQRLDRIELRRASRGIQTRDESHGHRNSRRHHQRRERDHRRPAGVRGDDLREQDADDDAGHAAEQRDRERLDHELRADVDAARADGAADADLARPLHHRGQHDVHDADAADEERDPGDRAHDDVEDRLRLPPLRQQRLGDHDLVVVRAAVQPVEQRADQLRRRPRRHAVLHLHHELVDRRVERVAVELPHRRRHRKPDLLVRAVALEDADDFQPDVVDLDLPADGGTVAEEIAADGRPDDADLRVIGLVAPVEEAPLGDRHVGDRGVVGGKAEDFALRLAAGRENFVSLDLDARQHALDVRHGLGDGLAVAQRDAERLLAQLLPVLRLHFLRLDDDVLQAEAADRFERFLLAARADRQHGDHGADAEDHAEHRQRRAELARGEVAERGREDLSGHHL